MAMEELMEKVEFLIVEELQRANAKFPLFNSKHEGFSVIKEELEETEEALDELKASLAVVWDDVRGKEIPPFMTEALTGENLYNQAAAVVAEAVQTAAMILKYDLSLADKAECEIPGCE